MKHPSLLPVALLALTLLGLPATAAPPAELREVIIVFKTHFDIGYTDLATNVVQRYRTTMIDEALKVVDQNRALPPQQQFAWTIPGWPATKILEPWPGQTPDRQQRVRQAFKEGRFVVHALPFSTHTELLEPEDLVRGLAYSSRLARDLSLELPRDAKMTDVPSHSWILPTLLRRAGVDFLHLGCNAASSSPQVPPLFWWEGPDGSRLLTFYSAAGYGTDLAPPTQWPYRAWLALIQTGDNHGPPRPDEVGKLLEQAKARMPGIQVRIGRLADFYDALRPDHARIPVVRGDMPDTWIHGPMCDPAGARLARRARPLLTVTDALATHLSAWGCIGAASAPNLETAREQSLLYGEHTWGGALSWVTGYGKDLKWTYGEGWNADRAAGRFRRLEESWSEHSAYIERARVAVEPVFEREMETLAKAVQVPGRRVVVFNPLPWKRTGLVTLPGVSSESGLKAVGKNEILPAWNAGDALCFVAKDLPPGGYRTYQFVSSQAQAAKVQFNAAAQHLESPFFKATLDPKRGSIVSLVDRRNGRELVDPNTTPGFGQYLYERFASNNVADYVRAYVKLPVDWALAELGKPLMPSASEVPYRAAAAAPASVKYERSAGAVSAILETPAGSGLPHGVTTRLTLYADLPYADLEVTLHNKPADPWPEAGWLSLPFHIDSPSFRLGRLGGILDPSRDFVAGSNHDLGAIHTGVALLDAKGGGVGICPLDSPLVSLERPGCFGYDPNFVPKRATVFVNLFNNQWSTNFRLWNSGTWSSRVRLWSFRKYEADAELATPALEARYPLQGWVVEGSSGTLPPSNQGLTLSRKGVAVTAFGPNPDGSGLVLRLWEYAGKPGRCQVRLPEGLQVSHVQPVDLRGRPQGPPLTLQRQGFTARLDAFAPASYQLNEASP